MTVADLIHARRALPARRSPARRPPMPRNVGDAERVASLASGALLGVLGLRRGGLAGLAIAGLGGALAWRGASGSCPAYRALGVDTAGPRGDAEHVVAAHGIAVEQALLVNRTPEDLYAFWRDFTHLPRVFRHLQKVELLHGARSRWTTSAPRLAGGSVSWEAEITAEEPGRRIAWRSLPGAAVATVGEIRFDRAPGERGTEVHVRMQYLPPAGKIGHWLATLVGEGPRKQMRDDLRRFRQLMETGEIATTRGQPVGGCLGRPGRA